MSNQSNKLTQLAQEIANTFNEINNFTFTQTELQDCIKDIEYQLLNEKYIILNAIKEEIANGCDELKELVQKVLAF
jgi:hypothetical protein